MQGVNSQVAQVAADSDVTISGVGAKQRVYNQSIALAVLLAWQLMVVLDGTIVNIALSHIRLSLGFSQTSLSWVVNAYALTFGGLLLLGGRAGDILGRRRVLVFGVLFFSAASALAVSLPRPNG